MMKDTTVMAVQDTTGQMIKNPLSSHKRGWCKRIGGQVVVVCSHVSADEAVRIYHQKLPAILARQQERAKAKAVVTRILPPQAVPVILPNTNAVAPDKPSLTVRQLRDLYISKKRADLSTGSFSGRSLLSTISALDYFCARVHGPVDQLSNQQFADYRTRVARKFVVTTLDRFVKQVRAMFAWAVRNHHISQFPPWGDGFNKVSAKQLRSYQLERQRKNGQKKFSRDEIHAMLAKSSPILQAMILLGINCGLGNGDVAELTTSDFDLTTGVLDYPRRKNHAERRAILWPETVKALRDAIALRASAAKKEHRSHVFLTKEGHPICRIIKKANDDGVASTPSAT